jgi:cardiolipin synthase
MTTTTAAIIALALLELLVIVRVLLRPHRDPASRLAWLLLIALAPLAGMLAYLLLGETSIGRARAARLRKIERWLPSFTLAADSVPVEIPERYARLFDVGRSISGFQPVGGNAARLLEDSNATIAAMVADIDAAQAHVHLLFYIWLPDNNGCKVVEALKRAAARGVVCRAMADGLGSRDLIHSAHWKAMSKAGVRLAIALPIGNPLLRPFAGRIDLRNHRKIVVIDDRITYCGSQNCADPEFRVKAKFAPWIDAVLRFEGPIARQNQQLFVDDWMENADEDLRDCLRAPVSARSASLPAQAFGTGPTVRYSAMPEMFESLLFAARRDVVISTPYYVPNDSMQHALCAAAYRGVDTSIVFPARNDSWVVAAASRSYYAELLSAGVKIYEYVGGLLHTKSFTVDGEITLIGSANMDRRSFELNYENNILLCDAALTATVRERQRLYIKRSNPVTLDEVESWSVARRLWNNAIAMLGPIL